MIRVGICGGIGSGKSTVCGLFAAKGIPVYDSDSRARALMEHSPEIVSAVSARFGAGCYRDGRLDRARLASVVFADEKALADLDGIVHPAVRRDFESWTRSQKGDYVLFESALLFDSGMDSCVDVSIAVLAPLRLRVERAVARDGSTPEQVMARIARQMTDDELAARADLSIVNIDREDLAKDVDELDRRLRRMADERRRQS